jgi:hypothetical protein
MNWSVIKNLINDIFLRSNIVHLSYPKKNEILLSMTLGHMVTLNSLSGIKIQIEIIILHIKIKAFCIFMAGFTLCLLIFVVNMIT